MDHYCFLIERTLHICRANVAHIFGVLRTYLLCYVINCLKYGRAQFFEPQRGGIQNLSQFEKKCILQFLFTFGWCAILSSILLLIMAHSV